MPPGSKETPLHYRARAQPNHETFRRPPNQDRSAPNGDGARRPVCAIPPNPWPVAYSRQVSRDCVVE